MYGEFSLVSFRAHDPHPLIVASTSAPAVRKAQSDRKHRYGMTMIRQQECGRNRKTKGSPQQGKQLRVIFLRQGESFWGRSLANMQEAW